MAHWRLFAFIAGERWSVHCTQGGGGNGNSDGGGGGLGDGGGGEGGGGLGGDDIWSIPLWISAAL